MWCCLSARTGIIYHYRFHHHEEIANGALHDVAHRIYRGVFCFQNITCFHDTCINVNVFIPMRKLQSFPAPTFTKPTRTHQNCMQTSYTKFYPYWTIDVESADRNSMTPLSKTCFFFCADFHKPQNCSRGLCGNYSTGFI